MKKLGIICIGMVKKIVTEVYIYFFNYYMLMGIILLYVCAVLFHVITKIKEWMELCDK